MQNLKFSSALGSRRRMSRIEYLRKTRSELLSTVLAIGAPKSAEDADALDAMQIRLAEVADEIANIEFGG